MKILVKDIKLVDFHFYLSRCNVATWKLVGNNVCKSGALSFFILARLLG